MTVRILKRVNRRIRNHDVPDRIIWNGGKDLLTATVFVSTEAMHRARTHVADAYSHQCETMGLLIGHPFHNAGKMKLEITASVPLPVNADAHHVAVDRSSTELTGWGPGADGLVVGWYHSHTGQGNFLSGTDRRTHERWFDQPYAVAMVIEAAENTVGLYSKHNGTFVMMDYRLFEI